MVFLTIFTPTYNRAHTLPDVYGSLVNQTDKDFVWLVVDDGSTDGTRALVEGWAAQNVINIRYVHQENGGKHIAFNHALEIADSELFWCLDSDDLAVPTSVERLKHHWRRMQAENSPAQGICFLLNRTDGSKWNEDFETDVFENYFPKLVYDGTIVHDVWFAYRTELAKRFRYPERWRKIYVPDSLMPYAVCSEARLRFVNERLGIYRWNPADADRLSNFSRPENLYSGGAASLFLQYWIVLNYGSRHLFRYPLRYLKSAIQFNRFADLADISLRERLAWLGPASTKLLAALTFIPGRLAAWLTRRKHRHVLNTTASVRDERHLSSPLHMAKYPNERQ